MVNVSFIILRVKPVKSSQVNLGIHVILPLHFIEQNHMLIVVVNQAGISKMLIYNHTLLTASLNQLLAVFMTARLNFQHVVSTLGMGLHT